MPPPDNLVIYIYGYEAFIEGSLESKLALVLGGFYNHVFWCDISVLSYGYDKKIGGNMFVFLYNANEISILLDVLSETIRLSESEPDPSDVNLILRFSTFDGYGSDSDLSEQTSVIGQVGSNELHAPQVKQGIKFDASQKTIYSSPLLVKQGTALNSFGCWPRIRSSSRSFSTCSYFNAVKSYNRPITSLNLHMSGEQATNFLFVLDGLSDYLCNVTGLEYEELVNDEYNGVIGLVEQVEGIEDWTHKDVRNAVPFLWEDFRFNFNVVTVRDLVDLISKTIEETGKRPSEVDIILSIWPSGFKHDASHNIPQVPSSRCFGIERQTLYNTLKTVAGAAIGLALGRRKYSTFSHCLRIKPIVGGFSICFATQAMRKRPHVKSLHTDSSIDINNVSVSNISDVELALVKANSKTQSKWYKTFLLSINDLSDKKLFVEYFESLDSHIRFSILSRICYSNNLYKMLSHQYVLTGQGIDTRKTDLLDYRLWIMYHLGVSADKYGYDTDDIIGVQFDIFTIGYSIKAPQKIFSAKDHSLDSDISRDTASNLKDIFQILPLSMHATQAKVYGTMLDVKDNCSLVNGEIFIDNFIGLANECNHNKKISSNCLFYIKESGSNNYIIVLNNFEADASFKSEIKQECEVSIYTMSGRLLQTYIDKATSTDTFIRSSNNVSWYVDLRSKRIVNVKIKTKFNSVSPKQQGKVLESYLDVDPRFGTIDLETYMHKGKSEVYALGFHTSNVKVSPVTFYLDQKNISKKSSSSDLILKLIDTILTTKYDRRTWYIHNFGGYDCTYILYAIIEANKKSIKKGQGEIYKITTTFRDDRIIKLYVKKDKYTMNIVDSYSILGFNLYDLCVTYETDIRKSIFPYMFITEKTLYYKGIKPGLEFWEKPDSMKNKDFIDLFNAIPSDEWDAKTFTLDYLENDLLSLHEIMSIFSNQIFKDHGVQVTNNLTISGLALDIYLRNYHKNTIPLINRRGIFEDIKKSYYGGIDEVYIPTNSDDSRLYNYDVNSLYPYASLNPMPGMESTFERNIDRVLDPTDKELFGFFYCVIESNNNYLGLLPHKDISGSIISPVGTWEGWYFSEEIKFAAANGYKIFVKKGHHFNMEFNNFNGYVNQLYAKKSNGINPSEIAVSKSLLNNLIGRFGLSIDKDITEIVDLDNVYDIMNTKRIKGYKNIAKSNEYLLSYNNNVDLDICKMYGVDYIKAYIENLKSKSRSKSKISSNDDTYRDVSIVISSAVNAYARIYMQTIKLDILRKGGLIYYTDTDSLITNKPLDDKLIGKDIGQFKIVDIIIKLYVISAKSYAYERVVKKGEVDEKKKKKIIIKFKGISSKSLSLDNIRDLYLNKDVEAIRYESDLNFANGYTTIKKPVNVILKHDMYKKRIRIFDDKGLWIDTTPLYVTPKNINMENIFKSNLFTNLYSQLLSSWINKNRWKLWNKSKFWGYIKAVVTQIGIVLLFTVLFTIIILFRDGELENEDDNIATLLLFLLFHLLCYAIRSMAIWKRRPWRSRANEKEKQEK